MHIFRAGAWITLSFCCIAALAEPPEAAAPTVDYLALSQTAARAGDLTNAMALLDRARKDAGQEVWRKCTLQMADLALTLQDAQTAERFLTEYAKRFPEENSIEQRILYGRWKFVAGNYREAAGILGDLAGRKELNRMQLAQILHYQIHALLMSREYLQAASCAEKLESTAGDSKERFFARSRRIYALIMANRFENAASLLRADRTGMQVKQAAELEKLELLMLLRTGKYDSFREAYEKVTAGTDLSDGDLLLFRINRIAAAQLHGQKRFQEAAEACRRAVNCAVDDAGKKLAMAEYIDNCMAAGDPAAAAAAVEKYLEFYPDDVRRGELLRTSARLWERAGKSAEAQKVYQSISADGKIPQEERFAAIVEALSVASAKKNTAAEKLWLKLLQQIAANDLQRQEALCLSGEAAFRHGEFAAAAKDFARAAAIAGAKQESAAFWQLQSLMRQGDYPAAAPVVKRLLNARETKHREAAQFYQAELLERSGDLARAEAEYAAFAERNSASEYAPSALYRAAQLAEKKEDTSLMIRRYRAFAERFPNHESAPGAWYKMQQAAFLAGDEAAMHQAAETLRSRYPASEYAASALFRMVDLYRCANRTSEALAALDAICVIAPDRPAVQAQVLLDKAQIFYGQDRRKEALDVLQKLIKQYPDWELTADAARLAGDYSSDQGEYLAAVEHYQLAEKLRPAGRFGEICRERQGDALMSEGSRSRNYELLDKAVDIYCDLAENPAPEVWGAALFKKGRALEFSGAAKDALQAYSELLYRAVAAAEAKQEFSRRWCKRAVYAAVLLHRRSNTQAGVRDALRIIEIGRLLRLEENGEYRRAEEELRNRYKF